ncbi:serine hydrolase [Peribacillus butanolivorans]
MKILLFLIGGIGLSLCLILGIGMWMFKKDINKEDPEYIVQFIKENAENKNVSLSIHLNDEKWVNVNANTLLPLASTVKIIVAIEYAQQAAVGQINPEQEVKLADIDRFYVSKTDGGAHEAWITQVKKDKEIDRVPLSEVVDGMIAYSSNANTDYLITMLGLQNINHVPESLGITSHEPMYPIVSSLFIPDQLMKEKKLSKQDTLKALKNMDKGEYRDRAIAIHNKWQTHPPTDQEKKQAMKMMGSDFQKNWSDRLPRATTEDYVSIMKKLNSKTHFDKNVYVYLDPVLEQLMKSPSNREWLVHAGQKGGSTAFVLTISMYAKDKDNNQTELAFFANDLTSIEQAKLSKNMNAFQLKFLTDTKFRTYVKKEVSNL